MAKDKSPSSNADGIGEIGPVASRTTSKFHGWILLTPRAPLTPPTLCLNAGKLQVTFLLLFCKTLAKTARILHCWCGVLNGYYTARSKVVEYNPEVVLICVYQKLNTWMLHFSQILWPWNFYQLFESLTERSFSPF